MIRTKSIFDKIEEEDGIRISVMSRHTDNGGKKPDPRITPDKYDRWDKDLAPKDKLVYALFSGKLPQSAYNKHYKKKLRTEEIIPKVKALAKEGLEKTITLLCSEKDARYCHRKILAEECQKYEPSLEVKHI